MLSFNLADTIAAISTPPGNSSLGIIRISGAEALAVAENLFVAEKILPPGGKAMPRHAARGSVRWQTAGRDYAVPALLYQMPGPRSFTGEDTAEFLLPGTQVVLEMVLAEIYRRGVRPAEAGEFTWRAFFHGRLNLTEVAAVSELISAADQESRRAAVDVLRRGVSGKITAWRDGVQTAAALLEAEIDFSEEETAPEFFTEMQSRLEQLAQTARKLLTQSAATLGRGEGFTVGLLGLTNAGKSSLFNALSGEELALVAAENSTTHDQIAHTISLDGAKVLLTDCPGEDYAESFFAKVLRRRNVRVNCGFALHLLVIDARNADAANLRALGDFLTRLSAGRYWVVYNKCDASARREDCVCQQVRETVNAAFAENSRISPGKTFYLSAWNGEGVEDLRAGLREAIAADCGAAAAMAALDRRTRETLANALDGLARAQAQLADNNLEFAAFELREIYTAVSALNGETYGEDILQNIFSRFCIGK